jgi:hypothetical protein
MEIATLPLKPNYTEPCNHCGQCCKEQLCDIARMIFPDAQAPCPAIQIHGGKALCGVVLAELSAGMKPVIQNSLGIGAGCSMPDADTTEAQIEEFDRVSYIKIFKSAECAR